MYKKATLIVISSFSFLLGWYFLYQTVQNLTTKESKINYLPISYLIALIISTVVCLLIPILLLRKKDSELKKEEPSLLRYIVSCITFGIGIWYLFISLIAGVFSMIMAILTMRFDIYLDYSLPFTITTITFFYISFSSISREKLG